MKKPMYISMFFEKWSYLSCTNSAMSQAANDSLPDNSFLTPSSGISLKIRVFFGPFKPNKEIHIEKESNNQMTANTIASY